MNSLRATVAVLSMALFIAGCATQDDLRHVSRGVDAKISEVQDRLAGVERSMEGEVAQVRKNQADLSADMIAVRDEIRILRGTQEELKAQLQAGFPRTLPGDVQAILERMEARLQTIEDRLDIPVPERAPGVPVERTTDRPRDSETLYSQAYGLFKEGRYEESRKGFREFLELFPETEYSDNARFWVGESYYFEGKYEEAILEYQKVIQDYPQGSRVSHALLKQALSFERLGETASARLLLQRVVRDFPGTTSAESARSKLLEIR